jgi:hypothetical protein
MRLKAFKSHGMNRAIARAISHGVNDYARHRPKKDVYSKNNIPIGMNDAQKENINHNDWKTGLTVMIIIGALIGISFAFPIVGGILLLLSSLLVLGSGNGCIGALMLIFGLILTFSGC